MVNRLVLCYASVMKQFLSQIKPKFLFSALIFLFASAISTYLSVAPTFFKQLHHDFSTIINPQTDFSELTQPDPETSPPITPENPPTSEDSAKPESPPEDESYEFSSQLIIKAVNPGYTVDKLSNVGELIELQNLADTTISLAGFSVRYTNGSGKVITLHTFPEGALMTGEFLLMRYTKSPDSDQSEFTYSSSLAMTAGPLELVYEDEVIDRICWTGKDDCEKPFKSSSPTTLTRNLSTGSFEHLSEYEPHFDPDFPNLYLPESEPDQNEQTTLPPKCRGLEFSEILTYYSDDASEQFVELYNPTSKDINLDGCQIGYKNKTYPLSGIIPTGGYLAYYPSPTFTFTKNPTTNNSVSLIDADGEIVDELIYPHGQKKSTSYALFYDTNGIASWSITYDPTPGSANNSQTFRTCPAGKILNPLTGNCVNLTTSTTTKCPAGKYRNPLTGRCKNIEDSASTLKECAEGYERNPTTNRCRKITKPNEGADYALVPTTSSGGTTFIALGIVILIVSLGAIYIALQFRHEAARAARKIRQRVHDVLENQLSRKIRRNRDKET